ncbi:hypothetical protein ACS04_35085 [Streptomyces roseus]|uniref:Uncharacterized protein n=1 Tax=Streptomyces roseus TaxID=66430 RepID=A0A0J6XEI2_9ACTN|nr:hypothetical protein ACS04_35085 [Streptomyces roseus]
MAPKNDHLMSLRAVRELRRVRSFYTAGVLLWASAALWSGCARPGSRQMWACALLLAVFTGLLATTSLWLSRLQPTRSHEPARQTEHRRPPVPRHASA